MPTPLPYNEQQLLSDIAKGDDRAFYQLFERYRLKFYGVGVQLSGSRHVAEEVVQETFIRIWEKRTYLAGLEQPRAYLYRIFHNVLYEYFRHIAAEHKARSAILQYYEQVADEELNDKLRIEAQLAMVQESLKHLTAQQLRVFQLIREEGLSRKEAAARLGISPNTVRNLLAEAMHVLRQHNADVHPLVIISLLFLK